jgi:hypothetical protein
MSFKPLRALIGLFAALATLYVVYGTFGTSLMVFKNAAVNLTPKLAMSASWMGVAGVTTSNFDYWFSSVWVIGVAIIVYTFLTVISSTDYDLSGNN